MEKGPSPNVRAKTVKRFREKHREALGLGFGSALLERPSLLRHTVPKGSLKVFCSCSITSLPEYYQPPDTEVQSNQDTLRGMGVVST